MLTSCQGLLRSAEISAFQLFFLMSPEQGADRLETHSYSESLHKTKPLYLKEGPRPIHQNRELICKLLICNLGQQYVSCVQTVNSQGFFPHPIPDTLRSRSYMPPFCFGQSPWSHLSLQELLRKRTHPSAHKRYQDNPRKCPAYKGRRCLS